MFKATLGLLNSLVDINWGVLFVLVNNDWGFLILGSLRRTLPPANRKGVFIKEQLANSESSYSQFFFFFFKVIKNRNAFHSFFASYDKFLFKTFLVTVP